MPSTFLPRTSWILMGLASVAAAGCGGKVAAERKSEAPRVTVAHPAVRALVDEDDYNGWLEAFKSVDVRARVRGHITKIHFKDGDIVKEGQPLFDLDAAPFEVDLKQSEAQARALESQMVAAKRNADRYRILIKSSAASQQELDKAEADGASFEAQAEAKKAEAERHRLDIKYAKIEAPLAGKISKANLTVGELVNAGGTDPVLTTIVSIDPVYVDFNVDERAIQHYQQMNATKKEEASLRERKTPFSFGLDTEEGYPHQGHLVFADNKYTPGTGTILVRGVATNPNGLLVPGSRVRVRVPVSDKYEATLVPDTAISTDQDQKYLLLVGDQNIAKRENVSLGRLLDDGMRVIKKPKLNTDAWIITEGMERARLHYPVEPVPESATPVAPAK